MDLDTPENRLEWYDNVLEEKNINYEIYVVKGKEYYKNIKNLYLRWLDWKNEYSVTDAIKQGIVDTIISNIEGITSLLYPNTWYALYLLLADFKYLSDEEKVLKYGRYRLLL